MNVSKKAEISPKYNYIQNIKTIFLIYIYTYNYEMYFSKELSSTGY